VVLPLRIMCPGDGDISDQSSAWPHTVESGIDELQKLEAVFREIPAAIALLRGDEFVFEMANDEYLKLVGRNDIFGKTLLEALPELKDQPFLDLLREVLTTGETFQDREVEVFLRQDASEHKPSKRVFLDFTYRRILDNEGRPYGVFVFAIDVTEKVSSRSSIQLEQVKLKSVFSNATAALAIVRGQDAIFEKANASYLNLFSGRSLIGYPLLEALPELKGQKFPDLISNVFSTGERYLETEARAYLRRTDDGELEERYFDQSYTRIEDQEGKSYGVLIHAIDVTERVYSRRKLKLEAEKSARLLQFMPTAFLSFTRDWILTYFNPAAEETLGLKASEIVGRSLWDVFPGLVGSRFQQAYEKAMKDEVRVVAEDYYPDFDRWYEAWAYPFDQGLAVSFFDITKRKADELRFRAEKQKFEAIFYGSASPLVFFRGPDLVYEIFNTSYQELVPKRELLGKPLLEALPELKGTAFPTMIKKVFDTGEPLTTYEELAPLVNPVTGEIENRYFDSAISLIHDGAGKPYGVFVQATEVTDRVLARKKIEQALAARDTFLSVASHELRTPITGMKLQAQMMKRALGKNDPSVLSRARVQKLVDQTDEGLTRINRLVNDMLDISRIHGGKLSLDCEPTDLNSFVHDLLERFSEELKEAGISANVQASGGELFANIDRFRMEQVLTNLITNAIKYAPGAPLSIRLEAKDGRIRMVFHDHGPGIAENDQERIFERFERLASERNISGMGLGLYIVRQIVLAHGGMIFAEADSVSGARFVMELPCMGVDLQ